MTFVKRLPGKNDKMVPWPSAGPAGQIVGCGARDGNQG